MAAKPVRGGEKLFVARWARLHANEDFVAFIRIR